MHRVALLYSRDFARSLYHSFQFMTKSVDSVILYALASGFLRKPRHSLVLSMS